MPALIRANSPISMAAKIPMTGLVLQDHVGTGQWHWTGAGGFPEWGVAVADGKTGLGNCTIECGKIDLEESSFNHDLRVYQKDQTLNETAIVIPGNNRQKVIDRLGADVSNDPIKQLNLNRTPNGLVLNISWNHSPFTLADTSLWHINIKAKIQSVQSIICNNLKHSISSLEQRRS